jgi:hypothetical protein
MSIRPLDNLLPITAWPISYIEHGPAMTAKRRGSMGFSMHRAEERAKAKQVAKRRAKKKRK